SAGAKILMLGNGPGSANIGFARAASAAGYQYFTTNGAGSFEWFDTPGGMLVNETSLLAVRQQPGAANGLSFAEIFKNGAQLHGKNVYVPPVVARGFNYIARST